MQFFGLVMTASSVTNLVLLAHRWVGLVLAPLFLLVLLSGTVLAFKPIVEDFQTSTTIDPNTLVALLNWVDARGGVRSISVSDGAAILEMRGRDPIVSYDLASGLVDITGSTGMRIIRAILAGERDPAVSAATSKSIGPISSFLPNTPASAVAMVATEARAVSIQRRRSTIFR